MVTTIKVPLRDAQQVRDMLKQKDILDKTHKSKKEEDYLYFPVTDTTQVQGYEIVEMECAPVVLQVSLKEMMQDVLSAEELEQLKTAFDAVGTIAILEIDGDLQKKETFIAQALLQTHPRIKTVLRKDGIHDGVYRNQKMKFLAGVDTRETLHLENNTRIIVDVETVYFSPRISNERARIAQLVKPGEDVLVLFSGAAPYVCVIGKNSKAKTITGIEINPEGHKYGLESVRLNKLKNVTLHNGDAGKIIPELNQTYDRIIMPLPKTGEQFLDAAISVARKGATIHYYDFLHEDEFNVAKERIKQACEKVNRAHEIIGIYTCGTQGVRTYRICVDFLLKE
ncbi:MAG: tRNA (guanine37-N1)-methyltransferase [Candidatus Woesearchaeota archaeon]|jgi:tRNA (guanine37-N1)-methyltransferase